MAEHLSRLLRCLSNVHGEHFVRARGPAVAALAGWRRHADRAVQAGKADISRLPVGELTVLGCCLNGDLMKGRHNNVRGLNLGRAFDKSCHHLQYLRIRIDLVGFGIGFVFPQTNCSHCSHINSAETSVISALQPFCLRSKGKTSFSQKFACNRKAH